MKKRKSGITSLTALILAFAITGCGQASSKSDSSSYIEGAEANLATQSYYEANADMDVDATVEVDESSQTSERKLITTVNISAESVNFDETIAWIDARTKELGGYIESSSVSKSGGYYYGDVYKDLHRADYTIRIPESKLNGFLSDVEGNTNITYKQQSVEDVTLTYTDIVARQEALESEKAALSRLMEQAESMEDIITIQSKLTDVQYELDSIKSQLRVYDNKIDYSTIYLSITEVKPDELTITGRQTIPQRIAEGFVSSLKNTGRFLLELIIAIIVHIPQLVVIGAIIAVIIAILKKKGNNKNSRPKQKKFYAKNKDDKVEVKNFSEVDTKAFSKEEESKDIAKDDDSKE